MTDCGSRTPIAHQWHDTLGKRRHGGSNYTIGRIDAQILASDVHTAIEKFVKNVTYDFTAIDYSVSENSELLLTREANLSLCQVICSLASRAQNRQQMLLADSHSSVLRIFIDAIMQRQYYPISNLQSDCGTIRDDLEQMHNNEEDEMTYLMNLTQSSLNALSYFLTDKMSSLFVATRQPSLSSSSASIDINKCICNANFLKCLKFCLSKSSGKRLGARLAVLRVISMMVEWSQALRALDSVRIFDDMVSTTYNNCCFTDYA